MFPLPVARCLRLFARPGHTFGHGTLRRLSRLPDAGLFLLDPILLQIADELGARPAQVKAAVELLDGGASVPFIARYRKEATAGLDDAQLRELETRLAYLRELQQRREVVLASIEEQGKLTSELRAAIEAAPTKQVLEDLYLPFKPKRRSKGAIAREAGIEPLADRLLADPSLPPAQEAAAFVNVDAGFGDAAAVLDGVRDILSERWAEDAALVGSLRDWLWAEGRLCARLMAGKDADTPDVAKFSDYFDYDAPIQGIPSHRALALFRARTQDILELRLALPDEPPPGSPIAPGTVSAAEGRIARHLSSLISAGASNIGPKPNSTLSVGTSAITNRPGLTSITAARMPGRVWMRMFAPRSMGFCQSRVTASWTRSLSLRRSCAGSSPRSCSSSPSASSAS